MSLQLLIRRGAARDLARVAAIQADSPEAAGWNPDEYPGFDFRVAELEGRVAGFLVGRTVAPGERELLNLAVAAADRRRGIGHALLLGFLNEAPGSVFLEVRESNRTAIEFYKSIGFQRVSLRRNYYQYPPEAAIVMKFHSC